MNSLDVKSGAVVVVVQKGPEVDRVWGEICQNRDYISVLGADTCCRDKAQGPPRDLSPSLTITTQDWHHQSSKT